MTLADLAAKTTVDTLSRGMPAGRGPTALEQVGALDLIVPNEDVTLPVLTLSETAFAHNLATINRFAAEHGVWLCAHGKTMMAPQLLASVLAGERTVGLCAATIQQASVMAAIGAPTVFVVNQLIGRANIARYAELHAQYPGTRFLVLVDSVDGIDQLLGRGRGLPAGRRFELLIEVGVIGGRAGIRELPQAQKLIDHIAGHHAAGAPVALVGVSTYEGAVPPGDGWDARVAALFDLTTEVYRAAAPMLDTTHPPILSAGGSATFDLAVDGFAGRDLPRSPQIWLRPGVAPTYDHVVYRERLAAMDARGGFGLNGQPASAVETFRPALALWAVVQSLCEPGLAIIGAGIRDFPTDAGYPTLLGHYRAGAHLAVFPPGAISISKANDQHAYLPTAGLDLRVGDVLKFGISHPCTAFDKWPVLFCVDDNDRVTRAVRTYF